MKVYIKTSQEGIPETDACFTAWQGFRALGYQPVRYRNDTELSGCRPDDLIVGRLSTILRCMENYGITVPEYDYPDELAGFLGRKIWKSTLNEALSQRNNKPVVAWEPRQALSAIIHMENDRILRRRDYIMLFLEETCCLQKIAPIIDFFYNAPKLHEIILKHRRKQ